MNQGRIIVITGSPGTGENYNGICCCKRIRFRKVCAYAQTFFLDHFHERRDSGRQLSDVRIRHIRLYCHIWDFNRIFAKTHHFVTLNGIGVTGLEGNVQDAVCLIVPLPAVGSGQNEWYSET